MNGNVKPGWQTSEFWLAGVTVLGIVLAMFFNVPKDQLDSLTVALALAVKAAVPAVAAVALTWRYISHRGDLKSQAGEPPAPPDALPPGAPPDPPVPTL